MSLYCKLFIDFTVDHTVSNTDTSAQKIQKAEGKATQKRKFNEVEATSVAKRTRSKETVSNDDKTVQKTQDSARKITENQTRSNRKGKHLHRHIRSLIEMTPSLE